MPSKFARRIRRIAKLLSRRMPPRVGVFVMQRNEAMLLPVFLRFYGDLVGYRNIHLFDNGSDPSMGAVLAEAEALGVQLDRSHASPADFARKGQILGAAMNRHVQDYDICLPLDCDEFIALKTGPQAYSCDTAMLLDHLAALPEGGYYVSERFKNHPTDLGQFSHNATGRKKLFFKKTKVSGLNVGFHNCTAPKTLRASELVHFELHHKPFEMLQDHARAKMAVRVDLDDPEALAGYSGNGQHLIKYLQMGGEADYNAYLDGLLWFSVSAVQGRFEQLGLGNPFSE